MTESTLKNQQALTWWETDERMDTIQAAAFFGMTINSFYVANSAGRIKLPRYKWGGKDYFKRSDCLKLIESKVVNPA